jgi:hypothetical protein
VALATPDWRLCRTVIFIMGQVDNLSIQNDKITAILDFCSIPRSRKEIQTYLGLTGRNNFYDTSLHRIYK